MLCKKWYYLGAERLFSNVMENIFFEIFLPKTWTRTVRILYRPPSQTNFRQILNMTFEKVNV